MKINPKLPHQDWMEEVLRKEHFARLIIEPSSGNRSWAYTTRNKIRMSKREYSCAHAFDYPSVTKYLLKKGYDVSKVNSFKHSFLHELAHHIVHKKITKKVQEFKVFYTKFNVKSHGKEFQRALLSLAKKYNNSEEITT